MDENTKQNKDANEITTTENVEEVNASKDAVVLEDLLEVKAVYDTKEKVAVASTNVVDRHGESISQEGWDLKNFKNNPVMLWAHDHKEIAVGLCKNVKIDRSNGTPRLVFTPEFHDKTPKAKALKALFEEGWLNSFSVGFSPKDFDGKTNTYVKQELLEISAVNVPANPDARMLAYKTLIGKGIEKSVAKDVMDIEKEPEQNIFTAKKAVQEKNDEKGAIQDELDEENMRMLKYKNMKDVQNVFWAFCDTYYDEETPVENFTTLMTELIDIFTKINAGTYTAGTSSTDEEGDDIVEDSVATDEVLDNIKAMNENYNKLNNLVETLVKAQENKDTSTAPNLKSDKEARAKQSLSKVIAKASDKLLQEKTNQSAESVELVKIIKKAADILNSSNKGNK